MAKETYDDIDFILNEVFDDNDDFVKQLNFD